jgi:CheY-like chemotaxis protein
LAGKTTILVAEDEEYNYLLIEELLQDMNFKFIHTKDGKETVEVCKINQEIGLVLMDIKMPIMDGHKAAQIIKTLRPDLPIIAQSAYALEHEIEKYKDVFDGYIVKPIDPNELMKIMSKYQIK